MAISKIQGQILSDNLTRSGINLAIETDLLFFDVTNDRIGINDGTPTDSLSVTGTTALTGTLSVSGNSTLATAKISDLTSGRLVYVGTAGELQDNSNLTFDGTTLTIDNVSAETGSSLTIGADNNLNLTADADSNSTGLVNVTGTRGLGLPVGTTGQRPSSPTTGTIRFNSFTRQTEIYNGIEWSEIGDNLVDLSSVVLNGDGTTTAFALPKTATTNSVFVSSNGVVQQPTVSYSVSGTTLTFNEAPAVGDIVDVRILSNITTVGGISNPTGSTYIDVTGASIRNVVEGTTLIEMTSNEVVNISNAHSLQLPVYTTTEANTLSNVTLGQMIYLTDNDGTNPRFGFYNGSNWVSTPTSNSSAGVNFGNWTITESANTLYFAISGVNKMKLDSLGNLTCVGTLTASGTI